MQENKKLKEEVSKFKGDNNTEMKKSENILERYPKSKNIAFDRNKCNYLDNNANPFSNNPMSENNIKQSFSHDINNNTYNYNESMISQDNNANPSNTGLIPVKNNPFNMNNMLTPYRNYGYPYNNPFIPF